MKISLINRWHVKLLGAVLFALSLSASAVPDTLEQRLAACAHCHGEFGRGNADNPKIPRLAEKPAGYLYKQMRVFQSGEGKHRAMQHLLSQLSPQYLQKISQYYASQQVPTQQHPVPELSEQALARGQQLVDEGDLANGVPACKQCHGQALTGVKPMIPGLLNQPYDYLYAQLELWRTNKRSVSSTHCMWVVARRLRQDDLAAVSGWLAKLPVSHSEPISVEQLPEPLPGWCTLEENEAGQL